MQYERRIANTYGIYSLWLIWFISIGSLVVVPIASLYISTFWIPLISFLLEGLLYFIIKYNNKAKMPSCLRLPHIVIVVLFCVSLVYVALNIILICDIGDSTYVFIDIISKLPILIILPLSLIVTLYNIKKGYNSNVCINCQAKNGSIAERGFLGRLYTQEGDYLAKMLLILSLLLNLLAWGYYFIFFISANVNTLDEFVFVWLPLLIFCLSLIYLGIRYFSLWLYYCQNIEGQTLRYNSSSLIRYIIICEDSVYLYKPDINVDNIMSDEDRIDTPARLYIKYNSNINDFMASEYFSQLSGIANPQLKFLYINNNFNTECNIFHYALNIDDKSVVEKSRLDGNWYTFPQIKELAANNKMSVILCSELDRLYTIIMAWKTYDKKGNRLYDIKHYKPTFRLKDIENSNVDFNDITWILLSKNNADCHFFRLRKIWNKYICGIGI